MSAEAVRVIVRCRPMNQREKGLNCKNVVKIDNKIGQCALVNPGDPKAVQKSFTFDGAYDTDSTTDQIYADIGYPLVEGVTEGYNGTIFAYGQTGCGKSFSMQGITDPASQRGIIPRAFDHIFETITVSEGSKYLVHASYLEIYNEEIRDLLGKDVKQKLELKEHPDKGVYVQTLSMHPCKNVHDCQKVMDQGWKNRATGSTLMNADSSRSHSIFSIHLERCESDESGEEHIRAAKLNLVDLAGSERQAKTGATGDRLKEATKINLSLSALGNVISALVDGKSKHIPYRDSKLTRLLQDSLGGNTKTLMVACLSPADNNYDETLSTLRYANRAKNIKNKPKINEDPKDALLREYQEEIEKLRAMLRGEIPANLDAAGGSAAPVKAKGKVHTAAPPQSAETSEAVEAEKARIREEYEDKMTRMNEDFEEMKISKTKLEEEMARLQEGYTADLANVDHLSHIPSPGQRPTIANAIPGSTDQPLHIDTCQRESVAPSAKHAHDISTEAAPSGQGITPEGQTALGALVGSSHEPMAISQSVELPAIESELDPDLPRSVSALDRQISSLLRDSSLPPTDVIPQVARSGQELTSEQLFSQGEALVNGNEEYMGGEEDDIEFTQTPRQSHAVHVATVVQEGVTAPRSSPTGESNLTQVQHDEALRRVSKPGEAMLRLQELQQVMVGGEEANNEEKKEKRKRKKKYAEERKKKLQEELAKMNGEDIMLGIFDNIHDELKMKDKILMKEKEKNEGFRQEVLDLQSEFEFERIDYLDTIRKQEQQMKWLQSVIDKIHPCLRRDCNYMNLDRVKIQSQWDPETQSWNLPKMTVEKHKLPPTAEGRRVSITTVQQMMEPPEVGILAPNESQKAVNGEMSASVYDDLRSEDRYLQKLHQSAEQDAANSYFKNKRAEKLLNKRNVQGTSPVNSTSNGYGSGGSGRASPAVPAAPWQVEPMSHDQLRAAQVHGQISGDDFGPRKPQRLEALAPVGSKSGKRRKSRQQNEGYY